MGVPCANMIDNGTRVCVYTVCACLYLHAYTFDETPSNSPTSHKDFCCGDSD